jgi:uncharacterized DUF497 family protein
MKENKFEWDINKNHSNIEKHGIDFDNVKLVFDDPKRKVTPDKRKDYGEDRYKVLGKIFGTIISVIFTLRNSIVRIISARKASQNEREEYNNQ